MGIAVYIIFAIVAALAVAFAVGPIIRIRTDSTPAAAVLTAALALLVIGVGVGAYLMLGTPALAVRTLRGADTRDMNSLLAAIAHNMRKTPDDIHGWTILARGYLTQGDPQDAAKAYAKAIEVTRAHGQQNAELYSGYGEAVARASGGAVPPEAEAAFNAALALDPKDMASRYFLGFAYAARGENVKALALWQSLLADTPMDAPYRRELVDRVAALTSATGSGAPDIGAMVAGLAARLKTNPDDPEGWQRLVRAYAVLGDTAKGSAALADARKALANDPAALGALEAEAKELTLE